MSEKRNEIFCFIENYIGGSSQVHENRHPEKLMLNYINIFSISEDDGYDISGIVHLETLAGKTRGLKIRKKRKKAKKRKEQMLPKIENHSQRKEALKCLSTATGNVHVFIFGMNLYVESNERDESYVDLKMIADEILAVIRNTTAQFLQVSILELRVSGGTSSLTGRRIDEFQVRELYRRQTDVRKSLNNQLEYFYVKTKLNNMSQLNISQESVAYDTDYFFLAEKLRLRELQLYEKRFTEIENSRFERKQKPVDKVTSQHERILQESKYKEHRLYTGFRATISFDLYSGNPDYNKLKLIYSNLES